MSAHTLILTLDSIEQAKLEAGEYVFPEHPESRYWQIRCDDPVRCIGYQHCSRMHICPHGHDAAPRYDETSFDGACPGHHDENEPNCYSGYDEFTFHGQEHLLVTTRLTRIGTTRAASTSPWPTPRSRRKSSLSPECQRPEERP